MDDTVRAMLLGWVEQRDYRRLEIEQHLVAGGKVREAIPGEWELIWPDCSPFLPSYNTPQYLAKHIAAREAGFGFTITLIQGH